MIRRRPPFSQIFTFLLSVASVVPAFAAPARGSDKVDRAVRDRVQAGTATQPVIITVKPGYRDAFRQALQQHGDVVRTEHPLIEALAVDLHSQDVAEIASQPWVDSIAADAVVSAKAVHTKSVAALLSQPSQTLSNMLRETLGLPRVATSGTMTGATGVTVAVIDSGIAPSEDFTGRITAFYDFTRGGIPTAPFDDYGHGTHVAGLIGSSGKLSNYQYQGIAPDVHLVGLKVLDSTGVGRTSNVIKAIEYVIANKAMLNVQILNLSLGHPILAPAKYDPLVQAIEKATEAGLICVVSAGNFGQTEKTGDPGYTGITSPGNAPSAITVGAASTQGTIARGDDSVAAYSSRGPSWFDAFEKPDVVAPGHDLASDTNVSSYLYKLLKANRVVAKNGQSLLSLSGSSMATAVTSGVLALMVQAHNQNGFHKQRALTANLAKAMLQFSAIRIAGADYLTQGGGEINAGGAIALADAINTGVTQPGKWWLGQGVNAWTSIGGASYAWAQQVIYGATVLGGHVLYSNDTAWATNIVWGTADGDNIVWGTGTLVEATNIVWSTNIVWGTNIVWSGRVIGQADGDNIVWGTEDGDNIVWGTLDGDNIVWGTFDGDNIVWGTSEGDNIVWGTSALDGDNIVWGTAADGDNIVWGTVAAGASGLAGK